MVVRFNITAGEFFEVIRPAAIILSSLISTWLFLSARKRFSFYISLLWAVCTLLFPMIVVPLYWVALLVWKPARIHSTKLRWKLAAPALYAVSVLTASSVYLYFENRNVDAHLFKAAQAKVRGDSPQAIREYQKALVLEDNPHTHKLLGIELANGGQTAEAIYELRLAENGEEPDPSISLRLGLLLESLNRQDEANLEYQRFLQSQSCMVTPIDPRCDDLRQKIHAGAVK